MLSTVNPFALPNGMTLLEYLKSDAFKERIRKAREDYRKKHGEITNLKNQKSR